MSGPFFYVCAGSSDLLSCCKTLTGFGTFGQDHLLPYMASGKHYKDTWFIVCEEDFRLERGHDIDIHDEGGQTLSREEILGNRELGMGFAAAPEGKTGGPDYLAHTDDPRAGATVEFLLRTARAKGKDTTCSQELRDMVKMGIFASRHGANDLLWYTWCPGKGRKAVPGHGSTCVGLSMFGARVILRAMSEWTPMHFDVALVNWMIEKQHDLEGVEVGFVSPSVGHFATHLSGCEKSVGIRHAVWDKPYIQEGTRRGKRYICDFNKKGEGLAYKSNDAIPLDDPQLIWKTLKPPATMPNLAEFYYGLLPPGASERLRREVRQCLGAFKFRNLVEDEEEVATETV